MWLPYCLLFYLGTLYLLAAYSVLCGAWKIEASVWYSSCPQEADLLKRVKICLCDPEDSMRYQWLEDTLYRTLEELHGSKIEQPTSHSRSYVFWNYLKYLWVFLFLSNCSHYIRLWGSQKFNGGLHTLSFSGKTLTLYNTS